ncbi:hypothetical protein RFI_25584, partial [Reticulomyxa filosa]
RLRNQGDIGRLWISNTRFHKMPIVKMLLSKTEDVVKILKDNDIQIGCNKGRCIPEKKTIPIKSNMQRQPKNYSYTDAAKGQGSNGNEIKNGPQKPKKNKRKNNKMLQNRLRLKRSIDNWMQSINPNALGSTETLDKAVESWTKCVVDATIGIRTIWKGNKPWWSDSLC